LWPAQARAIRNLEESLADNRPRALIQMATGAGKTFTVANVAYRLIKFAGARRALFLVDRANLGAPDAEGVSGVHDPGRRAEVHGALQRPAPFFERDGEGDDHDDPAAGVVQRWRAKWAR